MKSCSNSLVFVVNAKRSCGSWSHKWVLVCITLQSEPKDSNCILQPNYILSEKSSIIILLDASVSMWMNAVMRMLILDAVAQQGGRGARPPQKLGSQENSWLCRWVKYTKLCMVWQPNILNNCYELSGGYVPRTTHQGLCPWTPLGDFRSPDPLCPHLQILAAPLLRCEIVCQIKFARDIGNRISVTLQIFMGEHRKLEI